MRRRLSENWKSQAAILHKYLLSGALADQAVQLGTAPEASQHTDKRASGVQNGFLLKR